MARGKWLIAFAGTLMVGWLAGTISMAALKAEKVEEKMIAHNVFFTLNDNTEANRKKMIDACKKYLVQHDGVVYFACGPRVADLDREVNDKDFDIGLHIVFKDRAAHDKYQPAPDHVKFINENKDLWKKVRVFDSTLEAVEARK